MVMVDQRNHGASASLPLHPPHSIAAAAGDLSRLVQTELGGNMPKAVLGHSLGGKIVLEFLRQNSEEGHALPQQVTFLEKHTEIMSFFTHAELGAILHMCKRLDVLNQLNTLGLCRYGCWTHHWADGMEKLQRTQTK